MVKKSKPAPGKVRKSREKAIICRFQTTEFRSGHKPKRGCCVAVTSKIKAAYRQRLFFQNYCILLYPSCALTKPRKKAWADYCASGSCIFLYAASPGGFQNNLNLSGVRGIWWHFSFHLDLPRCRNMSDRSTLLFLAASTFYSRTKFPHEDWTFRKHWA